LYIFMHIHIYVSPCSMCHYVWCKIFIIILCILFWLCTDRAKYCNAINVFKYFSYIVDIERTAQLLSAGS
jgi:hypothetical protein